MTTIRLDGVTVAYGRRVVLEGLTCTLGPGPVALLGRNGVGKTSLLRTIAGILAPRRGSISIEASTSGDVRYAPQFFPGTRSLSVSDIVRYVALLDGLDDERARSGTAAALARVGLSGVADRPSSTLSGGMSKRLSIAQALVADTAILLLDEPTSGLDPVQQRDIRALIASLSEERLVVLSTHDLGEVTTLARSFLLLSLKGVGAAGSTSSETESSLRQALDATPDPSGGLG